jgi:hypothetical protein
MTDLEARADRVRAVVEGNHGKVLGRHGNTMRIEIPADIAPELSASGAWAASIPSTKASAHGFHTVASST